MSVKLISDASKAKIIDDETPIITLIQKNFFQEGAKFNWHEEKKEKSATFYKVPHQHTHFYCVVPLDYTGS